MKALLQLLDDLISESPKGKGRGRNALRLSLMGICGTILLNVLASRSEQADARKDFQQLDRRVMRIEARLGVTDQAQGAPAASLGTNAFAAAPLGGLTQ